LIHYHGTPLTPKNMLLRMAGKHFCVSFAHPENAAMCLQIGQSIMWDNGAFTTYRSGKSFDANRFYSWLEDKIGHPHWAVIPDVIGGDEEQQRELLKTWPFPVELGAPVWHMGMSVDYLLFLTDHYPRVCFGSSGEFWDVGSEAWCQRADKAFNALAKRHRFIPHIHMLRGLAMSGKRWPFASADSVNVARNYKDARKCPEIMARAIDGVQAPLRWIEQPEQQDLF